MSLLQSVAGISQQVLGGGWTPADLTGLLTWYDADDDASFTYSSGSIVSQWDDLSGGGYHLTQADTAKQPSRTGTINSRNAVLFDGTSDNMRRITTPTAPSKPYTYLAVARNTASSGQRNLVMASNQDGRIFRTTGGTIDIYQGAFLSTGAAWGTTTAHSVAAVFNGVSSKVAYDSNTYTTGTAGTGAVGAGVSLGAIAAGTSEYWQGEICEIVMAAGEIGSSDLAEWWGYATTKWGTP